LHPLFKEKRVVTMRRRVRKKIKFNSLSRKKTVPANTMFVREDGTSIFGKYQNGCALRSAAEKLFFLWIRVCRGK
jgi:hypothetical protein